jgi:DNA-binding response OmpR family regulator
VTRILIIEDNKDLAFGLRSNLEMEGYAVDIAETGPDGVRLAQSLSPDLVVLDLMLPQLDGYEVLKAIRRRDTSTPVLMLTARGEEIDKVRGLRLGADDYMTKPFGLMELLARIEALLRRSQSGPADDVPTGTIMLGDIEISPKTRSVTKAEVPVDLAPKEFDLLLDLARRDGAVASRLELMRSVWGHSSDVVSRTVDTHIAELRRKLEADPATPELIITVRKAGYRLEIPR